MATSFDLIFTVKNQQGGKRWMQIVFETDSSDKEEIAAVPTSRCQILRVNEWSLDVERQIANFNFTCGLEDEKTIDSFRPFMKPIMNSIGKEYIDEKINGFKKNFNVIQQRKKLNKKTKDQCLERIDKFKKSLSDDILLKFLNDECEDIVDLVNDSWISDDFCAEDDDDWCDGWGDYHQKALEKHSIMRMATIKNPTAQDCFKAKLSIVLAHVITEIAIEEFRAKFDFLQ